MPCGCCPHAPSPNGHGLHANAHTATTGATRYGCLGGSCGCWCPSRCLHRLQRLLAPLIGREAHPPVPLADLVLAQDDACVLYLPAGLEEADQLGLGYAARVGQVEEEEGAGLQGVVPATGVGRGFRSTGASIGGGTISPLRGASRVAVALVCPEAKPWPGPLPLKLAVAVAMAVPAPLVARGACTTRTTLRFPDGRRIGP